MATIIKRSRNIMIKTKRCINLFLASLDGIYNLPKYIELLKTYPDIFIGNTPITSSEEICVSNVGCITVHEGN